MKTPNALRLISQHYGFNDFMAFEEYLEFIEPALQQIAASKNQPLIRHPIWIHGATRTGKTTLARLLCADGQVIDGQLLTNNAILKLLKFTKKPCVIDDARTSGCFEEIVRHTAQTVLSTPVIPIQITRIIICSEFPPKDAATAARCIHVHTKRIKKSGLFKITVTPPARLTAI